MGDVKYRPQYFYANTWIEFRLPMYTCAVSGTVPDLPRNGNISNSQDAPRSAVLWFCLLVPLRRFVITVFGKGFTVACILQQRLFGVNTDSEWAVTGAETRSNTGRATAVTAPEKCWVLYWLWLLNGPFNKRTTVQNTGWFKKFRTSIFPELYMVCEWSI